MVNEIVGHVLRGGRTNNSSFTLCWCSMSEENNLLAELDKHVLASLPEAAQAAILRIREDANLCRIALRSSYPDRIAALFCYTRYIVPGLEELREIELVAVFDVDPLLRHRAILAFPDSAEEPVKQVLCASLAKIVLADSEAIILRRAAYQALCTLCNYCIQGILQPTYDNFDKFPEGTDWDFVKSCVSSESDNKTEYGKKKGSG